MTKAEFNSVFLEAINRLRQLAPKRTGHLANNAIKGVWVNETHFKIYIDRNIIENVAPVLKDGSRGKPAHHYYPQTINDKPNYKTYGWIEKSAREIAQFIANRMGGEIK
jgi:hypothetical protein